MSIQVLEFWNEAVRWKKAFTNLKQIQQQGPHLQKILLGREYS